MSIQTALGIDLNTPDVGDFLDTAEVEHEFGIPDFDGDWQRHATADYGKPEPITLSRGRSVEYALLRNRQYVHTVSAIVPTGYALDLQVRRHLFVRKALPDAMKQQMVRAFDAYQPTQDAHEYAREFAEKGIDPADYQVVLSYKLVKKGSVEHEEQDRFLRAFQKHDCSGPRSDGCQDNPERGGGCIFGSDGAPVDAFDFFCDQRYRLQRIRETAPGTVATPTPDYRVEDVPDIDDPQLDQLIGLVFGAGDCKNIVDRRERRIAYVFAYPEFRASIEPRRIKIGCIHVTILLPVLYVRLAKKALWAYWVVGVHVDTIVSDVLTHCLMEAAIESVILAILATPAAAAAAFEALFLACVERRLGQDLTCLVPGIAIRTERTAWRPI